MKRFMYVSQLKSEEGLFGAGGIIPEADDGFKAKLAGQGITCFQAYRYSRWIFVYMEAADDYGGYEWPPELQTQFEVWPGGEHPRYSVPLLDIFHDGDHAQDPDWRSRHRPEQHIGVMARLKPEMYASYVYYHYQLQEENPGSFNRSYLIGSLENYIFAYYETPGPAGGPDLQGKLQTRITPDNWQEVMYPHFEPWEDLEPGKNLWRSMETVYSYLQV